MTFLGLEVSDLAGLLGVALMLVAYAASAMGRLDPTRAAALWANAVGATLVLYSLTKAWNIASFVLEAAWLAVAAAGLIRLALKRGGSKT
jgi:hypothetical protein